jgi:hypothetical protein
MNMDTFQAKSSSFEIDHRSGAINVTIDVGDTAVSVSLSVVEASQLVAILHKHINEAAVEKLRSRNA